MDYIVTCAQQLSWHDLEPFVRSARANAPQARIVLFASRLPAGAIARLREAGVELHPFDAVFPNGKSRTEIVRRILWRAGSFISRILRYPAFCQRLRLRWGGLLLPRNQARFFAYRAWLEDCTESGDRLLLCDARDLIFQVNPFADFPVGPVAFLGEEEASVPLKGNTYNTRWYRETYGSAMLARHGDQPVVCAGVLGGERDTLIRTLDVFIDESCRRPHAYGADQAIINHLHYEGRLGCRKLPNGSGLIWHLYGVPPENVVIAGDQTISAPARPPCAVIHMYDRLDKTLLAVNLRWRVG